MINQNKTPTNYLRAVIVDDEPDCVGVIEKLLAEYCHEVQVVGCTTDSTEAVSIILKQRPDLLFLDIEMPVMNGFQILEEVGSLMSFQLIFTTAYDRYAVKAFKYSALDYLLKPVDPSDLVAAVQKATRRQEVDKQQLELLRRQLFSPRSSNTDKLALPYQHGYIFVAVEDILFVEADDYYARLQTVSGENYLITKTLREIEETLDDQLFFRIHRQYLVNVTKVKRFLKMDSLVIMSSGKELPVARNRKDDFGKLFLKI
jgi:two-component system, LytTR family, response regulator